MENIYSLTSRDRNTVMCHKQISFYYNINTGLTWLLYNPCNAW